jgi:DNA polymerase III epsilon subunit-like protein
MQPSDEQRVILEQVGRALQDQRASPPIEHGIIVDAVAGSGKTSTVLLLAAQFTEVDMVQVTYNAKLKQEVRQKANQLNLTNLEVHTYHSLAMKLYGGACQTDEGIVNILRNNVPLKTSISKALVSKSKAKSKWVTPQIVIMDEVQDSTVLLYSLMQKIFVDVFVGRLPPIDMYFGDCMQGVYEFKGADPRYLTMADQLNRGTTTTTTTTTNDCAEDKPKKVWSRFSLSTTFRLTESNAWFVNQVMLGLSGAYVRLCTTKPGPPITYVYLDAYSTAGEFLCTEILRLLRGTGTQGTHGTPGKQGKPGQLPLKPEDIMVIAPSIKHPTSPIRRLEHSLVMQGVPCYVPVSDDTPVRENLSVGKVLFSSFPQCKGLERECVIMYGFDASYFRYFARGKPVDQCTPALYVGATRPLRYMYVVHHMLEPALPFVRLSLREISKSKHVRFVGSLLPTTSVVNNATSSPFVAVKNTTVTELVQFLSVDASAQLTELCNRIFVPVYPSGRSIALANTVTGKDQLCENVSDVNGLVLTAMYECADVTHQDSDLDLDLDRDLDLDLDKETEETETETMSSIHRAVLTPGFARDNGFFQKAFSKITKKTSRLTISEHMYIGLLYTAVTDDLYCRLAQISQYDWISEETSKDVLENMATHLPLARTLQFECVIGCDAYLQGLTNPERKKSEIKRSYTLPSNPEFYVPVNNFVLHHFGPKFGKVLIRGRLDVCDDTTVWELKCVDQIRLEHKLQLVIYAFLWRKTVEPEQGPRVFRLFNIRTEEIWELASTSDATTESLDFLVDRIMVTLLRNKYPEEIVRTDSEFVDHCLHYQVSGAVGRSLARMTLSEAFSGNPDKSSVYMVLDTETTGFSANDHIIQLSYVICNSEFVVLRQYDELVTVPVEIKNTFVHGITNEMCRMQGRSFDRIARDTFSHDLQQCTHIVCHNAEFDMRMLKTSLERYQCTEQINIMAQKKVICTMNDPMTIALTNRVNTTKEKSTKPKPPTLAELYTTVTGKQMHNAHNALYDVLNLCAVLKQLWKNRAQYLANTEREPSIVPHRAESDAVHLELKPEPKKMRQTTLSFKRVDNTDKTE